ncbi:hypothetical protein [Rhodococcoides fascians]|uniref:hypothetical protein n=1 Tax=Rhodococcoides fascians TaxID=1828 RepID=UPI00050C7B5A|nr:hypothetical protein [Rhodococcus fascians]
MTRYVAGRRPKRPAAANTYDGLDCRAAIVDDTLVLNHVNLNPDGTQGAPREALTVPLGAISGTETTALGGLTYLLIHLRGHAPTRPTLGGLDSFLLHRQRDVTAFAVEVARRAAAAPAVFDFDPPQTPQTSARRERPIRDSPLLDWLQGG